MKQKIGLYNIIAKYYDSFDSYYEKLVYMKMREKFLPSITDAKILEVGVGTGKNLKYYSVNNKEIIAIDQSKSMVLQAKKKFFSFSAEKRKLIKLTYVSDDWGLKNEYFDTVVATFVLCTNNDPSELISKIYNVLKPNGTLLLFEWMPKKYGRRGMLLRIINPITNFLLGVSVNKKHSIEFFDQRKWSIVTKEFFDQENAVILLIKN